jgi:hypothetical protein
MPKPQLGKVLSVIRDPMVSDHFTLEIPEMPTNQTDVEAVLVQCQSAAKPGITVDEVAVALFGHTIVYAGRKVFTHDLNVTYVENVRGTIHKGLEQWAQLIRGSQTQHGEFHEKYAVDGKLTIYDNKGDEVLVYLLHGLWPANIPEIPLDGTASNLITHQVGFKYNWYECIGGYSKRGDGY